MLDFMKLCPAETAEKVTFWTSFPPPKEFKNQKLNITITAHLPSSWNIWWKSARQSWWYAKDLGHPL